MLVSVSCWSAACRMCVASRLGSFRVPARVLSAVSVLGVDGLEAVHSPFFIVLISLMFFHPCKTRTFTPDFQRAMTRRTMWPGQVQPSVCLFVRGRPATIILLETCSFTDVGTWSAIWGG